MNENNFEYLCSQLRYTGFGEALEIELREKLKQNQPDFTLYHETYPEDRVARTTLNFTRAKEGDMYFFNSYKVEMQKEDISNALEHTFYIDRTGTFTMKEAQNLMLGRAVNKDFTSREGQSYNAWVQMDFKNPDENTGFKINKYHQNYGYDLESVLEKYPIAGIEDASFRENLMRSLQKGSLQEVVLLRQGEHSRHFIEACPQFKTIGIYDADMKKMDSRLLKDVKQIETVYETVGDIKKKSAAAGLKSAEQQPAGETKNRRQRRSPKL